jgi:hypothetical protein
MTLIRIKAAEARSLQRLKPHSTVKRVHTEYIARKINRADLQESFFDELVCLDFDLPNQKIELVSEKPLLVRTAIASENYKMDKLFKYVDENQELYIKRLADAVAVKVVFYEKKF